MTRASLVALALLTSAAIPAAALAAPRVAGVLADHAVIQRNQPIVIVGDAMPGEVVTATLGTVAASAPADRTGRFRVVLPVAAAGGPFDLLVTANSGAVVLHDILIGDVFLCSGQSNMEMPVERMQDSYAAQFGPVDDQLRLVTIPKVAALTPLARFDRQPAWAAAGPQTAPGFSAACFYMAQDLRRTAKVPIGAIHSSWGGSQISAWMGDAAQRAAGRTREAELLALYARDPAAANRVAGEQWEDWWRRQTGDAIGHEPWQPDASLGWRPVPKVGNYQDWGDPALATFLGLLWYQNAVTLTPEQARQSATIALGPVDDADRTWINGKPVGGSGNGGPRLYPVPTGTLVPGRNVVTVSVANAYGSGGMPGPADVMKLVLADGSAIPLGGGWRYAVVAKDLGTTPRVPWDDITGAGTLYNAMIAPLGPVRLAGVAWYQGESDTGLPGYADRLRAMMAAWRGQFGEPALPFVIASLSGYGKPAIKPGDSGWGYIRDTQRRVAEADGHAAVAITVDIGDPLDIHPGEKHEVGRRLARAMRTLAYRDPAPGSGPRIASAVRGADGGVTLHFADVTGALHARSSDVAIGFELCGAATGSCRYAAGHAAGDAMTLAGDGRPTTRVRYAWADTPVVNLVDDAELPAGPFEIMVR
ncbi:MULTISPECIES: sialate O-acetylesterase [unclassified Sphingomonas]|uniref:sialate O-acetylesterase n=1 Tax=unclassified Sphingomonas TaxID=196159 RepID=UPI0022697E62|nr:MULTISPECIES: sialate O-acetylesterase [unclassified Sphingomonas]